MAILYTHDIVPTLDACLRDKKYDRIFLLDDTVTHVHCLPLLSAWVEERGVEVLTMEAGDVAKNLDTLSSIWQQLTEKGASRHSLLINLGGGVVTDLGGFAAATFKRGIDFINIPTTLLSMVDAAVGGKTGINFAGLKNEIGAFRSAVDVIVDTTFLRTLDNENICSGYAEMLKHALLHNAAMWAEHLEQDLQHPDYEALARLVQQSIEVKERIVGEDPHEKGLRKALNLGHTFGHAFESLALSQGRPVLHGYAVAWGIVCELYLSSILLGFPSAHFHPTVRFIRETYGQFSFTCKDYDRLLDYIRHDKKNVGGQTNFTLLASIGQIRLDCHANRDLICEALDFLREG